MLRLVSEVNIENNVRLFVAVHDRGMTNKLTVLRIIIEYNLTWLGTLCTDASYWSSLLLYEEHIRTVITLWPKER